jgi:hypothetical protein
MILKGAKLVNLNAIKKEIKAATLGRLGFVQIIVGFWEIIFMKSRLKYIFINH